MTVGELLDQVQKLVDAGVCTNETPVLADGCDCWGEALAAVVVPHGVDPGIDDGPNLLISRERHESKAEGIRVGDLPRSRTFITTEAKGS